MQVVANEVLAMWTKKLRLSGQESAEVSLGPAAEVAVSPMRSFGRARYYQYSDGRTERLVVTSLPDATIYRHLIQPRVEVLRVGREDIEVRVRVAPYVEVESVVLTFGQPAINVPSRASDGEAHSFPLSDLGRPVLGGYLNVLLQTRVAGTAYTVEQPVPYVDLDHLLAPAGLAALDHRGAIRIFVDGDPADAVDRIAGGLAGGLVSPPILEPIARGRQDHPFHVLRDTRLDAGLVAVEGIEYLAVADDPERLALLDSRLVRQMVSKLSWEPVEVAAQAGVAGVDGRLARWRRAGAVGLLRARRRVIVRALDALGYERYNRTLRMASRVRRRNAYWEYVQRTGQVAVRPRTVLHVGFNNLEFSGHLARLAVSIAQLHPAWEQVIVADDPESVRRTCLRLGIRANVVTPQSRAYGAALLSAEIILTDSTLPRWFTPTPYQRLYNVWHGTPLKAMGRSIGGDPRAMSNTQRNFLQSAAVLLSNEHTITSFVREYAVPPDNFELMPSPRNSWLYEESARSRIRSRLGVSEDEMVVLYLPTWRGESNSVRDIEENVELFASFSRVLSRVERPARFYAKPHRFTLGRIDPEEFGFRLPPDDLDLYQFLPAVDCLVTDYSSVLFDFAPLNKPIILDVRDLEQYAGGRGLCLDPASLGLPMARDEDALARAIQSAPADEDHEELTARFAPLDGVDGADRVVQRILQPTPRPVPEHQRERVLLFPGGLWTNGITTSFLNLLSNLDRESREYWVFLPQSFTSRPGPGVLETIVDSGIRYLPTPAGFVVRREEKEVWHKFESRLPLTNEESQVVDTMMLREADRIIPGLHFDHLVNFSGYEAFVAKFLGSLTLRGSQMHTWVHNDMGREQELRRNFNEQALMEAYRRSTTVNVVSRPVADRLESGYFPVDVLPRVRVVHNTADSARVRELAHADVDYMTPELSRVLRDPSITRFISIGRFSPEKDHLRLVEAFDAVSSAHPERSTALFLIGGPGNSREMLLARVAASRFRDRIHIFEGVNPHPILSRCDLFVLSSHYEGLPMVFFEALALDVPILSTAIPGPREFLDQGYGSTCEDSTEGLIQGMEAFLAGRLPGPTRSLADFNQHAVAEFEAIFTGQDPAD